MGWNRSRYTKSPDHTRWPGLKFRYPFVSSVSAVAAHEEVDAGNLAYEGIADFAFCKQGGGGFVFDELDVAIHIEDVGATGNVVEELGARRDGEAQAGGGVVGVRPGVVHDENFALLAQTPEASLS